jgi:hypothetical protein
MQGEVTALRRLVVALALVAGGYVALSARALPASDAFTRADTLNDLGANWTAQDVTYRLGILTNRAYSTQFVNWSANFWSADAFSNDQYSQIVIVDDSVAGILVTVRASGTSVAAQNFYAMACDQAGGSIVEVNSGSMNVIGTAAACTNGDTVRTEVSGTTITVKVNGATVGTTTDATIASGSAGIGVFDTNVYIDDFAADNLTVATVPSLLTLLGISGHP